MKVSYDSVENFDDERIGEATAGVKLGINSCTYRDGVIALRFFGKKLDIGFDWEITPDKIEISVGMIDDKVNAQYPSHENNYILNSKKDCKFFIRHMCKKYASEKLLEVEAHMDGIICQVWDDLMGRKRTTKHLIKMLDNNRKNKGDDDGDGGLDIFA